MGVPPVQRQTHADHVGTDRRSGRSALNHYESHNKKREGGSFNVWKLTFIAASKTKRGNRSDDAKDIVREDCDDLALAGIRLEE